MKRKSGKVVSPAARAVITGIIAVCMMLMFSGCGQSAASTLQDIASSNADLTKTIKQEIAAPDGMTSDVSFSGDSFDVTFKYDDPIDDDMEKILVKAYGENTEDLSKDCESAIDSLQEQTKITGITCTIHIVNSSGDETWSYTYPEQNK